MRAGPAIGALLVLVGAGVWHWRPGEDNHERLVSTGEVPFDAPLADGATETDTMRPQSLSPGEVLDIELRSPPQSHYLGELEPDADDEYYSQRVSELGKSQASYDPWLSRAARELAYQGALTSESPPESILTFILASSGAPEGSVAQLVVLATGQDTKVVDDAITTSLNSVPGGSGRLLIGIGEAATDGGDYQRRVVIVTARRDFELEPTPRLLSPHGDWRIVGRAPDGFSDAHASILYPDDRIEVIDVTMQGARFELSVPTGRVPGELRVSIDGIGKKGPGKLLQLSAAISDALPREFSAVLPDTENFESASEAEEFALQRLLRDRRELGLGELIWDRDLSDIARSHSEEMRDLAYFAHLSPNTGLAGQRLAASGYRASAYGENLALNDSVAEAQQSLMDSIGHRRNIVNPLMTHVGIGIALNDSSGSYTLTQLFAKKVQALDRERAGRELIASINRERKEMGLQTLSVDSRLSEIAEQGCVDARESELELLPNTIAKEASDRLHARVGVRVAILFDVDEVSPDETSLQPGFHQIGVAFLQDTESGNGRITLVVIVAE